MTLSANIYGPNNDDVDFYDTLSAQLQDLDNDYNILCGDWNLIQDFNLDTMNYKHINNPVARSRVLDMFKSFSLCDPWRIFNPNVKKYTWQQGNQQKFSRLDFFATSEVLLSLSPMLK